MKSTPPVATFLKILAATYPTAHCELDYSNPFQLLVATILSAQCTDKRVNTVTPLLFQKYPSPAALAQAHPQEIEEIIHPTGFFRAKTKSLLGCAKALVELHGGQLPQTMEELTALPGVGRKTANVVLGNAFGLNEGIVVDTHVARLSMRLGLTRLTDPVKIEKQLMSLIPRPQWMLFSHWLVWHGRRRCPARKPDCPNCELQHHCPAKGVSQRFLTN